MQLIPRRKRKPVHRYAAHQVAVPVAAETVRALSAKLEDWQAKVLRYADLIPEVMTGYLFVQNTMDMVTFEIQRFDRHTNEWVSDESPAIQGIERRLNLSFKAGRAAALGHLVEEAYVLVKRTDDNGFVFETLAPTEIKSRGKTVEVRVMRDGEKDEWVAVPNGTTIIRIYTPDPSNRNHASGPHKPLLGLLEMMALELSRDQADAISVLAGNGILYIPTEILPDEVDTLDASTTPGSRKGFEDALEEAMIATIADRQRGDAVVPITLYGPAEYAKDIRHILPTRAEGAAESQKRMEGFIKRYAHSIDLPGQIILGIGDANHWADWKVDENTWAYALKPRGTRIADAIYAGLIRQIICNLGLDPNEYRLAPDASRAIAKTDMSKTSGEAYKAGAITVEAYAEHAGFDPGDIRPDADELLLCVLKCDAAAAAAGPAVLNPTAPDRTAVATLLQLLLDQHVAGAPDRTAAASTNPRVILRQASKIANSHQTKLENLFRRYLAKVAEDAARDGRRVKKQQASADKTAADEVPFLGYAPATYFAKYREELEAATTAELFTFLRRIATLVGLDYHALRNIWSTEFTHRAQAVATQAEKAAEVVAQRSLKSGKPVRIADNTIRTLSSTANGGTNEGNGGAGNTQRPTHAGQDPVIKDALTAAVGSYATQYTWHVGHPDRPYPPHQALDGRTWLSWQEFDALDVPQSQQWLLGSVYFPGDHDGCQCEYSIEFLPQEATA